MWPEGGLGAVYLGRRLWESCLLILLHLAGSCLPEAGKVAKVPTGPETVLSLLSRSLLATGQGGPAGGPSPPKSDCVLWPPRAVLCHGEEPRLCSFWVLCPGRPRRGAPELL